MGMSFHGPARLADRLYRGTRHRQRNRAGEGNRFIVALRRGGGRIG
jgi:hypothetical protein